ncbi:hypothetical protein METSCH_C07110 [Metschnikowia aff. pulcherrima]|uniref:Uncharacterized protein n=1 Tax=Metschnikowia aff. pulcherrima TaxID=2163413 RepID=A0A4P6XMR9_9ASCO|nr:hypothetical protein METSCH_C07110 [Metschnikowia aff. pulcherrima]
MMLILLSHLHIFVIRTPQRGSKGYPKKQLRSGNGTELFVNMSKTSLTLIESKIVLHKAIPFIVLGKLNADIAYLKKKPGVCLRADIPDVFWPEAIRTAASLVNWTPSRSLG